MSRVCWTLILCCAALALPPGSAGGATSARRVGLVLLREGVGARAAAMGEAYTAVAYDQTAAFWNPAGVAALRGKDFLLSHHRSFLGIQQVYAGWAYGNGSQGLALSLGIHSAGGLEARTGPSVEPLGTFSMYDLYGGIAYACHVGQHVWAGAGVRVLHEAIGPEDASGVALDFGVLCRTPVEGLSAGASVRNWGRTGRLDRERIPLPLDLRIGIALVRGPVAGSVDARLPEAGSRGVNVGAEYRVHQALFLRGGYRSGADARDVSFGLGVCRRNWRVDYAFTPASLGLDGSHRIALGIR